MPRKYSKKINIEFSNFYSEIAFYRSLCSKIISAKKVLKNEKEKKDLVESILLKVCAKWEKLIDEVLIYKFSKDTSLFCQKIGIKIKKVISLDLSHAIVIGSKYFDFKDTGDLIGKTGDYFKKEENIFKAILPADRNRIDEVYKIRNYLSHYSKKSKRTLFQMYKKSFNMKRFVNPGNFLLKKGNYERRRTRFVDIYINTFGSATKAIEDNL